MALTTAQVATLKAYINSIPEWAALPLNSDTSDYIARELNKPASPAFPMWNSSVPADSILDAIDFTKFTPNDASDNTITYLNRALFAQTKQLNLQLMLQGRTTFNAVRATLRASLRDAVIQVPTGVAGAMTSPGGASGANVLNVCTRPALLIEKVLTGAEATTGTVTAALPGYEGAVSYTDIDQVRSA